MPRIRQIKPEILVDDELSQATRDGRLLFIYLWMIADREGRLEDRPAKIKAQVFPFDSDLSYQKIDGLLSDLHKRNFIIRYSADGHKLIQIRTFTKHQRCHIREVPSTYPAPTQDGVHLPSTNLAPTQHQPRCPASGVMENGVMESGVVVSAKGRSPSRRCPPDFVIDESMTRWAKETRPDLDIEFETDKFRDHTFRDTRTDWPATWRNWIRSAHGSNNGGNKKQPSIFDRLEREAEEEERCQQTSKPLDS